ncbi:hypothetical protein [Tenacibaculum sp. nBUS_03]|uniref:hypothetical protein n=1 Tax=Tenacibaculum sp. nBUS_03 TaxID=3395320 RepID=UPI003EBFD3CD
MNLKTTHFYHSKKLYSAFFIMLCLLSVPCFSQTTEDFEDETNSSKSFTNNGQTFTTVDSAETYDVNSTTSGSGWNGSTSDDVFLDNSDAVTVGGGTSLNIKSSDGTDFLIKSFYLYIAQFNATQNPTSLNVTILGKKDGNNVFTFTKTSGFSDIPSGSPNNGFTLIDFSSEGGSDNTNSSIDEIIITTTGNADYLALDGFRWDVIPCAAPDIPTITATTPTICKGGNTNLNISNSSSLNDATNWHIYTGSCGGTLIGVTATGTFNVSPTTTTTYYIRGEGGCVTPGSCGAVTVTVNDAPDASFNYDASTYCKNGSDPTPTITEYGGFFTSSPAGIAMNITTGKINLTTSDAGTYTITYTTTDGSCSNATSTTITINQDDASFRYDAPAFCVDSSDPLPNSIASPGGTFSSAAGLNINTTTGKIDVSASTPGTYTVSYTTTGACPNTSTKSVTIYPLDDASFSYASATYCSNDMNPAPNNIATPGGTFSSPGGLSIDSTTGRINTYASAPGTHTVVYTTAGNCPNSATTTVTINTAEDASFAYPAYAYCLDAPDPSPSAIASPGGTFSSTPGLAIAANGTIDVSASTPGTYTIRYTKTGICPNSATTSMTIKALDDASFSYPASAYCVNASDPSPNSIATPGGTFSSTNGLVIASNGTIDVSASTPGTYSITYTTAGACPNSASANLTINALDDASFSYGAAAYCSNASDPSPTITGLTGGSFSSTPGLVIASNGTIDVSASTPNTYTVTYTTAGACPNSSTTSVTINALDDPRLRMAQLPFVLIHLIKHLPS